MQLTFYQTDSYKAQNKCSILSNNFLRSERFELEKGYYCTFNATPSNVRSLLKVKGYLSQSVFL